MKRYVRSGILLLACFLLATSLAYGQAFNATLTGLVKDASSAVVPNANVTLKNAATGDTRKTVTNSDGYFSFVAIPTGEYFLTVDAQGFQKWERKGLTFTGGDKLTVPDIVLQVGQSVETISVSAVAEILTPVDSGEKSTVLTTRQLQEFTVVGRSAAEFIKIMPGFSMSANGLQNRASFTGEVIGINGNGDGGSQSALNGAYTAQGSNTIDITADGAHVSDPGCNCATPVNPNTDMIQEFKVMTNSFSAENSKGPVVINTVAKSGTRDFHGEAYTYVRHYSMNANDWSFNSSKTAKPENKYIFPGGNISGPLLIPGTDFNRKREKLFFFTGFEYYKQTLDTGLLLATVPTAGMRNGDFSPAELAKTAFRNPDGSLKNSTGGAPGAIKDFASCPGGICPKNLFYPGAQNILNLYPMPNKDPQATGGYNYIDSIVFGQNSWQSMSRVDYSLSDNTKLFIRANFQAELQVFPVTLWWRNGGSVPYPTTIDGKNSSQSYSASLTHVFSPSLTNEVVFGYTKIAFPNVFHEPDKIDRNKLGYTFKGIYKNGVAQMPSIGSWTSELATMYQPSGFQYGGPERGLYADKWLPSFADNLSKVWGTHTMKFGMYYEWVRNVQPGSDQANGWAIYQNWQSGSSGNQYADLLLGRPQSYQENNIDALHDEAYHMWDFYAQDSWKVTPRLTLDYGLRASHMGAWYDRTGNGFAVWNPGTYSDASTVKPLDYTGVSWTKRDPSIPLSGWGTKPLIFAPRFGIAFDVFGTGKTVVRGGWGQFRYHTAQSTTGLDVPQGRLGTSTSSDTLTLAQIEAVQPSYAKGSIGLVDRTDEKQPLTTNWNFTISQRLPGSTQFEAAYVGSSSRNLAWTQNINNAPVGAMWKYADPTATSSDEYDANRLYRNYQDINILQNRSYSNYHSFQTTLMRQRGRWNYQFNYTWSKLLGINGSVDSFSIDNNYGIMPNDRTHIFNAAYSVELPGVGSSSRILKGLANGWQVSGITQFQSGVDLAVNSTDSRFNLTVNDAPSTNNPFNNKYILGTNGIALRPLVTCDPTSGLKESQFVNGSCFALPTQRGVNGPIRIPAIRGPWFANSDLSMFKNFVFSESRKLQFRFSAYNFLNHPMTSFNGTGDNNLKLTYNGATAKLDNSTFGYANWKYGHRVVQLALKFYF